MYVAGESAGNMKKPPLSKVTYSEFLKSRGQLDMDVYSQANLHVRNVSQMWSLVKVYELS